MISRAGTIVLLTLMLAVPACSGVRPGGPSASPEPSRGSFITAEEILRGTWSSAFELIRSVRGHWLHRRGEDTIHGDPGQIQVHVDGVRVGGVSSLHTQPVAGIVSIEYVDALSATMRWGTGYGRGAIIITTGAR